MKLLLDAALTDVPPFLTYFPAVTVAAIFLGGAWGAAVLAGAATLANLLFFGEPFAWPLRLNDLVMTALFAAGGGLIVAVAVGLRRAVRQLEAAADREHELNAELQHRVKNNLAVVQALARQTIASTPEPETFYPAFRGRLIALGEAHDVLRSGEWSAAHLPDLAEAALRPFRTDGRFVLAGPRCRVPAQSCVPLVLALHELATNAVKYGALSTPAGQVTVTWSVADGELRLAWREAYGPPVVPPRRRGLGSRLLARQSGLAEVSLRFEPEGVACDLRIEDAALA